MSDTRSTNWDSFACGYATAILWANAYHYVHADECDGRDNGECLPDDIDGFQQDEDATYAYQTPGDWWNSIDLNLDDAREFFDTQYSVMVTLPNGFDSHGHDFALTRNGHGAGFWDRGYGPVGDSLSEAAKVYGEHSVITDDGPTVTNL